MGGVSLYLPPFLSSFSLAILGFLLLSLFLRRCNACQFSIWKRRGGLIFLFSFSTAVLLNQSLEISSQIAGILIGLFCIAIFGFLDDQRSFGWQWQLIFQVGLVGILLVFGFRIFSLPVPFLGTMFLPSSIAGEIASGTTLLILVVFLVNSLNWADGIDGLFPGVVLVSSCILFLLSLFPDVNQPPLGILSMALLGSMGGLLIFNIAPARFFAGTSGSFGAGFLLAAMAVISGTKIATLLLALAIPAADALWVIGERVRDGKSPFQGRDGRHLHFRLRSLGWSDIAISLLYAGLTGIIGILALYTRSMGKFFAIISVFLLAFFLISWIRQSVQRRGSEIIQG